MSVVLMYRNSNSDYLRRGGSNFDEPTQNYYRIHAGRRSSFNPLSLSAAVYWSNTGQGSSYGDLEIHEAEGRQEADLPNQLPGPGDGDDQEAVYEERRSLRLGNAAFQYPSRRAATPSSPEPHPADVRTTAAAPSRQHISPQLHGSTEQRQLIRSQPHRAGERIATNSISRHVVICKAKATSHHGRHMITLVLLCISPVVTARCIYMHTMDVQM
ncbi:hypothetical protein M758_4G237400 [Ceratodon purpureus]|nr:hypothetical protein M758_4G237400 [Ceratodon purpureus]